jgi:transitional endoplasmic reticulum ATPase
MPETPQQKSRATVRVAAAGLEEAGEPHARVSRTLLRAMGLKAGTPVRLVAGGKAVLLHAQPAGLEDDGLSVVRIDGMQRRRLGVEVGDTATLERYDGRTAILVRLVALGQLADVDLPMDEIRRALAERPVIVGDTVRVTPTRKTFDAQVSLLGLTLAGVSGAVHDTEGVLLRVTETTPRGVVSVDEATEIEIGSARSDGDDGASRA